MKKTLLFFVCACFMMTAHAQNQLLIINGKIVASKGEAQKLSLIPTDSAMQYEHYFAQAIAYPGTNIPVTKREQKFKGMDGIFHYKIVPYYRQGIRLDGYQIDVTGSFKEKVQTSFAWHVLFGMISFLCFSLFLFLFKKNKVGLAAGTAVLAATASLVLASFAAVDVAKLEISYVAIIAGAIAFAHFILAGKRINMIMFNIAYHLAMVVFFLLTYLL